MKKTNQYLGPSRLNILLLEKAKICWVTSQADQRFSGEQKIKFSNSQEKKIILVARRFAPRLF